MNTAEYHHPRMLKDILIEAATDGWAQAGVFGATLLSLSQWIVVTFGDVVGQISTLAGLAVVLLVIAEKAMAVRAAYRKMRKEDKEDDPFDGTELRK